MIRRECHQESLLFFERFSDNTCSTTQRYVRIMYKFWLAGIVCSLVSSSASLVRLRADSRRFALSSQVAKEEEKDGRSGEEAARQMSERRERGKALLECVFMTHSIS